MTKCGRITNADAALYRRVRNERAEPPGRTCRPRWVVGWVLGGYHLAQKIFQVQLLTCCEPGFRLATFRAQVDGLAACIARCRDLRAWNASSISGRRIAPGAAPA